jgi:hypothetical protein
MKKFPCLLVVCCAGWVAAAAGAEIVRPFESSAEAIPTNSIDGFVLARLAERGIQAANACSDEVFLRRVYLDTIGTLPTSQEATQFLQDAAPGKRTALIDRLLARDEFADYWAMKWCDLLRVKSEFPINLWPNAVQAYQHWIRASLAENMPYDRFARELLTASGSNFRVPQANFYRAVQSRTPKGLAQAVALTFMGTRLERWPSNEVAGIEAFFSRVGYKATSEWKEEIVFFDAFSTNAPETAVLPGGRRVRLTPERDPREIFADWLVAPDNPWFARNIANRIWSWLLGRGLVHEPDDLRPDNPASHPDVLAWLEKELVASKYDLKHIYRLILSSRTYQLSSIPRSEHPDAEALFAFYPLRRLDAEVLIDALCSITGTTEKYSSPIPEPFTFIPEDQRSIELADGSITSSFLEMFGRPARDTGLESERGNSPTAAQRLHLLNSSHIRRKIEQSDKLRQLVQAGGPAKEVVTRLYLAILSRAPTDDEVRKVEEYMRAGKLSARETAIDVVWALINGPEFLYRH